MINAIAQWASKRLKSHGVLVINSSALAFGTGTMGLLGFVYWLLAARYFSPEAIGTASAYISLIGFVGVIGEVGLGMLVMGEIMQRPKGLLSAATVVCFSVSLCFGGIALILSGLISKSLKPDGIDNLLVFIGCGLTGFSQLIDYAFIGLLHSGFRMTRQLIFAILKLAFIVIIAKWTTSEGGILATWIVSLVISLVVIDVVGRRWWGLSMLNKPDFKTLYKLRFSAGHHYMLDMGITVPAVIMPYLVAVLLSPASNAVFTMIWLIISVGSIIPGALSTVLFPVVRASPEQYCDKMKFSFAISILFAFAFGILIFFFSADILSLFNKSFAVIADHHLKYLGFGMIGSIIKSHVCAAARINNRMRQNAAMFGVGCLYEVGAVAAGCYLGGLEGLSVAWAVASISEGIAMMFLQNPFHSHGFQPVLALKD